MSRGNEQQEVIAFSLPSYDQAEADYVHEAMQTYHRHGSGKFTAKCVDTLKAMTSSQKILLTHSCTGALEMMMLLMDIKAGDEVIMPSYTFSSTANAVVLRDAIPVFADIDAKTQCLDPQSVEKLITPKTRAILPVHYAGLGCDMSALTQIAKQHHLYLVEDAAQAVGATYNGQALGTIGEMGAFSFHDSKNISCGEGGALLINDERFIERAEILWEKGTNRSKFMRGQVDKYTWVDVGSSFLPSEVTAAFLLGQLERVEKINAARCAVWERYYAAFAAAESEGLCQRPFIPNNCVHNGHIFYLLLPSMDVRDEFLDHLKQNNISATFHYVPLHDSPAGKRFGRAPLPLPNTDRAGQCLVRLPLFPDLKSQDQDRVISVANAFLKAMAIA